MNKVPFFKIHLDSSYMKMIIDNICHMSDSLKLRDMLEYVIMSKYHLFDIPEFKGSLYEDED